MTTPRSHHGRPPAAIGAALLAWSARTRRDLPWRATRDPWAVLVSEAMLQQTQVVRVIPRWMAFMARFPTPAVCAAADVGDVIGHWAGLGYNRRAVNLHRSAVEVCARHGGTIPADLTDLLALPGVGPYTARAVMAFAYERDVGVVDTNAARVLARAVAGRPLAAIEGQRLADSLVPSGAGWAYNQAILDLGAGLCTSRNPDCEACPLERICAWRLAGGTEKDPAIGSAGTGSRQSVFADSDRQGRGRLVAALRSGSIPAEQIAARAGWPEDPTRAHRVAATLIVDGLAAVSEDGTLRLP